MSGLATSILVSGDAEKAIESLQRTAASVRETARIAGASAREQYESAQLAIKGIVAEQEASETAARAKLASSSRVQAAWEREKLAQDRAIDTEQASARAKEMAALKADILARSTHNAAAAATAYSDTLRLLGVETKAAAESQELLTSGLGHSTAGMAYASASVRTLEGHVGTNTRAVERFLSQTLGLAQVLEAAFPIVGAAALVGILVEMAQKAYLAYQNIFNLKSAIEGLDKMEITVTERVQQERDRQEQSVEDILEHTGGHEAALRQRQSYQGNKPLDNSSYFYSQEFIGLPNDIKTNYETMYKSIAPADVPDRLTKIKKEVTDLQKAIATNNEFGGFGMSVKSVNGYGPDSTRNPDAYYAARLKAAQQIQSQLEEQAATRSAQQQAGVIDIQSAHQQKVEDAQRKAEQAARAAQAAQRQADADHLRSLQEQWDVIRDTMAMQPGESKGNFEQRQRLAQSNFFADHLNEFSGAEHKTVLDATLKPLSDYNKTDTEGREALTKMLSNNGQLSDLLKAVNSPEKDTQAFLKATDDQRAALEALADKQAAAKIVDEQRTGEITKYDAAVQLAALHTREYADALAKIAQQRQQVINDPTLSEDGRRAKLTELDTKQQVLGGDFEVQSRQDADAQSDQTGMGAMRNSLRQYVAETDDSAQQVTSIWSNALSGINNQFVKLMTGQRSSWTKTFSGLFGSLSSTFLQKGEGAFFKALGLGGKPDGSASNPLNVRIVGSAGAAAGGLSSVFSSLGGTGKDPSTGMLSGIGSLFSGLGFADGGQPPVGVASLVGERGKELFVPSQPGTIIPNHMLGGGDTHNWNIDARGSNDPAATIALIKRAAPAIVAASMHKSRESAMRRPASAR